MTTTPDTKLETESAKQLLALHNLPMDAATLNNGLILAGILENKIYLSTTGSGEEKSFIAFTPKGDEFGLNIANHWHGLKTEPKYFNDRFADAYLLAANAILMHAQTAFEAKTTRARSIKIADPALHFSGWHFVIDAHHYWTLGVELKTYVLKKVPYKSYATMTPPEYNFSQGYIFYARDEPDHYLQIGSERDLLGIEVFEGWRTDPNATTGWITTMSDLANWLEVGVRPEKCRKIDFSESKSGLIAWQLIQK